MTGEAVAVGTCTRCGTEIRIPVDALAALGANHLELRCGPCSTPDDDAAPPVPYAEYDLTLTIVEVVEGPAEPVAGFTIHVEAPTVAAAVTAFGPLLAARWDKLTEVAGYADVEPGSPPPTP